MYDVHGRPLQSLRELSHLEGYRGSFPVRIGNDATGQLQHDVYGSAISAAVAYVECGGTLARDEQRLLIGFGRQVCATWRQPDNGLWEVPGPRRHYVHSKLMCWSALDALLRLDDMGHLRAPREDSSSASARPCAMPSRPRAISTPDGNGSYVGAFGEAWADASLLIMARLGFHDPASSAHRRTEARIWRELGRDGLLLRYLPEVDGLDSREGAFGICGFWARGAVGHAGPDRGGGGACSTAPPRSPTTWACSPRSTPVIRCGTRQRATGVHSCWTDLGGAGAGPSWGGQEPNS